MKYAKSFVAAGVAALTAAYSALSDDKITNTEWVMIGLATLGAIGVWAVPNKPSVPEVVQDIRSRPTSKPYL